MNNLSNFVRVQALRRQQGLPVPPIGLAAGELAMGAAAEGLKRLSRGQAPDFASGLLTGATAQRLASHLANLRGAAMKLGQILSLQGEEMLPPEFAQALAIAATRTGCA